jgi:cytidylate kinase
MAVITITGLAGTGEKRLAQKIADKLGYEFVDRSIFEEVLKEYGIVDSKDLLEMPLHFFSPLAAEQRNSADLLNKMYLVFAKRNNVVLHSRRAFAMLHSFASVLSVFLKAPKINRIQNLMSWEDISERSAVEKIEKEERTRKKIIESYYKKEWDSLLPWTLVLNTHKLGLELCEKFIIESHAQVATLDDVHGWQDGFPSIDTIEVDPILEKAVNKVLADRETWAPRKEDDNDGR